MSLRGLTIIIANPDPESLHAALTFAAAGAAAGSPARVHLHEAAVALLGAPLISRNDAHRAKAGLPTLAQIFREALGLGVRISICQSGLALAGLTMERLDPRIEASGPVALLGSLGDDRLLSF